MPEIRFLIIGVQKGGTTSLFEYVRRHPQIHMPSEKEIAFFDRDGRFRRGWDWYLARVTRGAPPDAICGEASTYYMSGSPFGDVLDNEHQDPRANWHDTGPLEEVVPRRIKEFLPDVKLICVLRDPVARAYSAYRMMVLERAESRSFDEAINQLIVPSMIEQARAVPTLTNGYIVMGEYSRILAGFLSVFPPEQLMVIFSNELASQPTETLPELFEFIDVAPDFVPDNLSTHYRTAAVKERITGLHLATWQRKLTRVRLARRLWHVLPERGQKSISRASYRVRTWNAKRDVAGDDMSPDVRERLRNHFRPDGEALGELLARDIPWLED